MMRSKVTSFMVVLALSAVGCGGSAPDQASAPPAATKDVGPPPEAVVKQFLDAVKAADHLAADQLLTPAARGESEKSGMSVAPPGSPTASFEVGDVEYRKDEGENGAHVASKWSDEVDGEKRTDTIVWILRKEPEGWRIAGMATKVFEGEPPLILNFEDHAEMQRKQAMVEEELARRSEAVVEEASKSPTPVNKLR